MHERGHGNAEQGIGAQEPAHHDHARDRGQNDGAENAGAPAADHLFNYEQHRGNGSVESCGKSGGGAHGSEKAQLFA